jgi:hypothetical protein
MSEHRAGADGSRTSTSPHDTIGEYRALAVAALAQLQIHSPTSYSWYGATSAPLAPDARGR